MKVAAVRLQRETIVSALNHIAVVQEGGEGSPTPLPPPPSTTNGMEQLRLRDRRKVPALESQIEFLLTVDPHVGASPANGSLTPRRSLLLREESTLGPLEPGTAETFLVLPLGDVDDDTGNS